MLILDRSVHCVEDASDRPFDRRDGLRLPTKPFNQFDANESQIRKAEGGTDNFPVGWNDSVRKIVTAAPDSTAP